MRTVRMTSTTRMSVRAPRRVRPRLVAAPPCTATESCRGAATPQPGEVFGAPSSSSFSGEGNLAPQGAPPAKPAVKTKTVKCRRGYVRRKVKKREQCVRVKAKKEPAATGGHADEEPSSHGEYRRAAHGSPISPRDPRLWGLLGPGRSAVGGTAQATFLPSVLFPRGKEAHLEPHGARPRRRGRQQRDDAGHVHRQASGRHDGDRRGPGRRWGAFQRRGFGLCAPAPPATSFPASAVTCTWQNTGEPLEPYETLSAEIDVEAQAGAALGRVENEISVSGGEGYSVVLSSTPGTGNFAQANCDPPGRRRHQRRLRRPRSSGVPVPPLSQTQVVTIGEGAPPSGSRTTGSRWKKKAAPR